MDSPQGGNKTKELHAGRAGNVERVVGEVVTELKLKLINLDFA
jgi:hypothetical protein